MRVFIPGEWGRPMAVERQVATTRLLDGTLPVVRRFPNYDAHDAIASCGRTPDVFEHGVGWDEWFSRLDEEIERFAPDLILTCFLSDPWEGSTQERWGKRVPTFCVSHAAARMEADRHYARAVAKLAGIRVPLAWVCQSKEEALASVRELRNGAVLKTPSGRVDGEYAEILETTKAAEEAILVRAPWRFPVSVEERISGIEIAFAGFVDYRNGDPFVPMLTDLEYTRLCAGDVGCETSEMGIHDVAGVAARPIAEIFEKLKPWFREVGYVGWFDASCIYDPQSDELVPFEFMTRLGSCQTENLMVMVRENFAELALRLVAGQPVFRSGTVDWCKHRHSVATVVVASGHPAKGAGEDGSRIDSSKISVAGAISGLESPGVTRLASRMESVIGKDLILRTKGQRAFAAVGAAGSFEEARDASLWIASRVSFRGAQYRNDIGHRWGNPKTRMILGAAGLLPGKWWE